MNYVYDILLNFQKKYYDFYEWNTVDEITHIRKILLFRISDSHFNTIKNNIVGFDKDFMEKIYNRTERFKKINVATFKYVFLISNGKESMALKLDKNGIVSYKSGLLLDENEEISDMSTDLKLYNMYYRVIKDDQDNSFQTREEKENRFSIMDNLNCLYENKEKDKLKYLYLECFSTEEKDINIIFSKLKTAVMTSDDIYIKISDFFNILNQK